LADRFSKKKRSQIMSAVKNKNTTPEIRVRKALFAKGFRYKINDKSLPGSPDIVLMKYHTAIFVHGCFWHGHRNCKKATRPTSNVDFWNKKIERNIKRDIKAKRELRKAGWQVIIVWQCKVSNIKSLHETVKRLIIKLKTEA
jgi:DNA mismatch endonuclease (patch repair protein)